LTFSLLRNLNKLNLSNKRYQYNQEIQILNGIKAISTLLALYGSVAFFSWYGVYTDPIQIINAIDSYSFTFTIGSALYAVPILFFAAGFTHSFSLLNIPDEKRCTVRYWCGFN